MTMKGGAVMHKGVFKGATLSQKRSILILGESHHHGKADDPEYTTERVVKNYFNNPKVQFTRD